MKKMRSLKKKVLIYDKLNKILQIELTYMKASLYSAMKFRDFNHFLLNQI